VGVQKLTDERVPAARIPDEEAERLDPVEQGPLADRIQPRPGIVRHEIVLATDEIDQTTHGVAEPMA
jgi:hypothetical protein